MRTAHGTTNWTLTVKRRLAPGRYVLFARAVDAAGNRGRLIQRSVRIKH